VAAVASDSDGDGNYRITDRYLHSMATDAVLSMVSSVEATGASVNAPTTASLASADLLWMLTDHLGSVRDVVSAGGNIVRQHINYDAFGNRVGEVHRSSSGALINSDSTAAVDALFGYAGREWDDSIDLQYNRARWYDPATGRFISQDPIGFEAGDANLYRYVGNGVMTKTDPSGLTPPSPKTPDPTPAVPAPEKIPEPTPLSKNEVRDLGGEAGIAKLKKEIRNLDNGDVFRDADGNLWYHPRNGSNPVPLHENLDQCIKDAQQSNSKFKPGARGDGRKSQRRGRRGAAAGQVIVVVGGFFAITLVDEDSLLGKILTQGPQAALDPLWDEKLELERQCPAMAEVGLDGMTVSGRLVGPARP
jgi:RHS repeat-associated protein